jgi:hypothetical protein
LTIEHFQESVAGINLAAMGGIGVRPRPGGVRGLERGTVPQSSKASPDPIAVAPDGIEQQCEVTIKEGMLDETILIMVVDKRATITVNSNARLGSLSS